MSFANQTSGSSSSGSSGHVCGLRCRSEARADGRGTAGGRRTAAPAASHPSAAPGRSAPAARAPAPRSRDAGAGAAPGRRASLDRATLNFRTISSLPSDAAPAVLEHAGAADLALARPPSRPSSPCVFGSSPSGGLSALRASRIASASWSRAETFACSSCAIARSWGGAPGFLFEQTIHVLQRPLDSRRQAPRPALVSGLWLLLGLPPWGLFSGSGILSPPSAMRQHSQASHGDAHALRGLSSSRFWPRHPTPMRRSAAAAALRPHPEDSGHDAADRAGDERAGDGTARSATCSRAEAGTSMSIVRRLHDRPRT